MTCAGRLIFLQPYYTTGPDAQATYDAAKKQAIGRSRRYGRTKTVHVYHFLTTRTIEIDYFEAREQGIIEEVTTVDSLEPTDGVEAMEGVEDSQGVAIKVNPLYRASILKDLGFKIGKVVPADPEQNGNFCSGSVNLVSFDDDER